MKAFHLEVSFLFGRQLDWAAVRTGAQTSARPRQQSFIRKTMSSATLSYSAA
jgi:hypothetical protein